MASCGPSRASLLTGRHPPSTRVFEEHTYWRNVSGNFMSIPQYFRHEGYLTIGMGKIFHQDFSASGGLPSDPAACPACLGNNDEYYSWNFPYKDFEMRPYGGDRHRRSSISVPPGADPLQDELIASNKGGEEESHEQIEERVATTIGAPSDARRVTRGA